MPQGCRRGACLTCGERRESAKAWREGNAHDQIGELRRGEAERAVAVLGAEVFFYDAGGYLPLPAPELTDRLVAPYSPMSSSPTPAM
ncbi:hypothetical protein [Streptomyces acidiscabies]|uniref:hypothetical protein n=1 Tax=Streptomyces acidiscabies TaxID=42234 RepID=UPI000289CF38|nr:hypothetical protein [Streptomyces sp. LBUM 1476]MBZ3916649.1 hypothetical protein [Streptomyces acidiscabies]